MQQKHHGHAAIWLSMNELASAMRDLERCSGVPKGCCTTPTIWTTHAADKDPPIRARKEPFNGWIKLWHSLRQQKQTKVRKTYYNKYPD